MSSDHPNVKLTLPDKIEPEKFRALFEKQGYKTVTGREISIDVYDILSEVSFALQLIQFWSDLLKANGISTNIKHDLGKRMISAHSATIGQQVITIPFNSLDDAITLPRAFREALHQYGTNVRFRAERMQDTEMIDIMNQHLDQIGPLVLGIWNLIVGEQSEPESRKSEV